MSHQIIYPVFGHNLNFIGGWPRLSNQMFQYAVAQLMAFKNNSKVFLQLDRLNTVIPGTTNNMFVFQKYFKNVVIETSEPGNHPFYLLAEEKQFEVVKQIMTTNLQYSVVLQGYFQNSEYFKGYEEYVKNLFEFNDDIDYKSLKYLKTIREKYSNKQIVSVHLRRPDIKNDATFIYTTYSNEHITSLLNKFSIENTVFLLFSSDKEDCLEKFSDSLSKVNHEWVDFDESVSLCIMSNCDHNIIGASTFGWWAAYLNKNKNKRVIIPYPWFNPTSNQRDNYVKGLYVDGWETFVL